MKKVLYISYDGMTDPLGQSQVLPYLRELSKYGYQFHLVSFEKEDRFKMHRDHIRQICSDSNIFWHPQDYHREGGIRKTVRQIRRLKKVVHYLHDKHEFQMTHCRSYISALAGIELKQKKGVKMIFDMRGFWADERVDGGLWDQNKLVYRIIYNYFKRKEKIFLEKSDYIISLTENGKNEIESWAELNPKPTIEVIPCCVDLELFDPNKISKEDQINSREKLTISETAFVLGYVGSIGTWYMLPEMMDYFNALSEKVPNAIFLFISAEKSEMIYDVAKQKGIDTDKIRVQSCLHNEVPLFTSLFSASIFFIRPTFSKKASSPTKQGELMAMGIPIVCNTNVGDTDHIISKYNSGILIDSFDRNTYLENLISEFEVNKSEIEHGAEEYFSLQEGVKRYLRVYDKVNGETNPDNSSVSV